MENNWDGIMRPELLSEECLRVRTKLADHAKAYDWPAVFSILSQSADLVNACRPGGKSLYTPLHQAAHAGASVETVFRLIQMGAWRTLQNARGERAADVAERMGHRHLQHALEPVLKHRVPMGILLKIQSHFHEVIRNRIDALIPSHELRLPELEILLELEQPQMWFRVPGMYGGFGYHLESFGADAKLVVESWCRVVEGSGERHEITTSGSRLVEKGFV